MLRVFIMAQKEATVFVIDVGRSMGQMNHGRTETDLDFAMKYVWEKITYTVFLCFFPREKISADLEDINRKKNSRPRCSWSENGWCAISR